jgi:hypothetical protein
MTVYVVQKQMHLDREKQEYVERFDLSPAKEYGELKYLLSPTAAPFRPESVLEDLYKGLEDFTDEDYLLLVGNPVLIGLASSVAAMKSGTVNFLQWSGKDQRYLSIRAEIF